MIGTITKRARKNGKPSWGFYFLAGLDEAGRRIQPTKSGFATKAEADAALRDAIAEHVKAKQALKNPPPVVPAVPAVQDVPAAPVFAAFFDRWMLEHAGRRCAPKTVERYRELGGYAIRQTLEIGGQPYAFGNVPLDRFRPMQMELTINSLRDHGGQRTKDYPGGRPLSPKSVRHIGCVIHSVFEKAVIWELIARNPMDGVELPKALLRNNNFRTR